MKIGFIGLGRMGYHMARNLAAAGHEVAAYDVLPEAVARVSETPGIRAASDLGIEVYTDDSDADAALERALAQTSPEAIPLLFARAWNERDADALASLFDEDAEFVNETGLCWHDRASIRKAHASRLQRLVGTSMLAAEEPTVKLLSPDVGNEADRRPLALGGAALRFGARPC